jgi:TolB-like protein
MKRLVLLWCFLPNVLSAQPDRGLGVESQSAADQRVSGKYHAIVISENQYQDPNISDLVEPKNDADKLVALLTSKYFFQAADITRLIDPTRADIYQAIEKKTKSLSIDDNLLVFYAGHGYWDEQLKMGYFLPADAQASSKSNWISNADLSLYLSAIQSNHILLISDACFSGGIFKMRSLSDMDQGTSRLYSLKSRKAITSGNLKEVPDNSILMRFLLKELEQNQRPFLSSDKLFYSVRANILNNSTTQPMYGVIFGTGDEGGEFVFYNPGVAITKDNTELIDLSKSIQREEKRSLEPVMMASNNFLDKPKRVAILNFDNTSGKVSEYGDLGGPLRDMLSSDLSGVKNLTMVDRQALEKVLAEQKINNTKSFDPATATKVGKLLGAEVIITGTYFELFGSLRVDAKFLNVETGQIVFSVGVDGAREKFLELKNSLANKIVEKLKYP